MDHGPAVELEVDHASDLKSKLGIKLFLVYSLVYIGFIAINVIEPMLMERMIFKGLNLAVVYGMGLIFLAIIMGLIYNHICTRYEEKMNEDTDHDL
jgi:uncharacterized membrane protein (DUF485 family)